MAERKAGPVPEGHDCEKCGCYSQDWGFHQDGYGLCLACGGCGDRECCTHDEWCRFEDQREKRDGEPTGART